MSPNKTSRLLACAAVAAAALALPSRTEATVSVAASFEEKVESAQAIVLGRVVKKETRFDDERRMILTYTTLEVEKALKGGTPQQVTVITPGGRVGEVQQTTVGVPDFEVGGENVVFLRDTRRGPTVLFFDQGAYDVVSQRGERVVRPVSTEAVLVDAQRGMAVAPEEPRSLREFEAAVQSAAERTRFNRMKMIERQQQQAESAGSLWETLSENSWLLVIAAIGLALATVQFIRRS